MLRRISRKKAKEKGLIRFYTGAPCVNGHVAERYVRDGYCVECNAARANRYASSNRKKVNANRRAWYKRNSAAYRKWMREWRKANPEKCRAYKRKHLPEPTRPEPKRCELCSCLPNGRGKTLHLDHDHRTGKFRGWLCSQCNTAIGSLGDCAAALRRAVRYLEKAEKD